MRSNTESLAGNTDLLRLAVIDPEFRAEMVKGRSPFADSGIELPSSISDYSREYFDVLDSQLDSIDIVACASTCTMGPVTVVCDGTTKSPSR